MKQSNQVSRVTKVVSGVALLSAALTAAGLSFIMNVTAGLAVSLSVAVAFALSDVVKVLVPITCQAIGWNKHLRVIYIVASLISVVCASLFLADQFGHVMATKQNTATVINTTEQQISDIRASLKDARAMALSESQRGGCGPKCKALNERVAQIEVELKNAVAERKTVNVADATDGKAKLLASFLGMSESEASSMLSIVLIISALIIGELCSHLSGYASQMLKEGFRKTEAKAEAPKTNKAIAKDHQKRSAAAKKGWETRRRNAAAKKSKEWTKIEAYTDQKALEDA